MMILFAPHLQIVACTSRRFHYRKHEQSYYVTVNNPVLFPRIFSERILPGPRPGIVAVIRIRSMYRVLNHSMLGQQQNMRRSGDSFHIDPVIEEKSI